jgi:hypothetical protein
VLPAPVTALGDVELVFTASADLSLTTEWIDVELNGVPLGGIFQDDGSDCPALGDETQITVPAAVFNNAIDGGLDAAITMEASVAVDPLLCDPESFIAVSVSYVGPSANDVNINGIPDDCECPADIDVDGTIGITDFLLLLAAWGECPGCAEDIDGDGEVGVTDFLLLLAAWGACF